MRNHLRTEWVIVGLASVISAFMLMTWFWLSAVYEMLGVGTTGWVIAILAAIGVGFSGGRRLTGLQALAVANAAVILGFTSFILAFNVQAGAAIAITFIVLGASLPIAGFAVLGGRLFQFLSRRGRGVRAQ